MPNEVENQESMLGRAGNFISSQAKDLKDKVMGTEAQNEQARKNLDKIAKGEGMQSDIERGIRSVVGRKKGGKIEKDWHGFKGGKTGKHKHGF